MDKRNLSGLYIITWENNKNVPVCFEEAPYEVQKEWMETLTVEELQKVCLHLANTINRIGNIKKVCSNCNTEVEPIPLGQLCPNCACDM